MSILQYLSKIMPNLSYPKPCTSCLLSSRHRGPLSRLHLPVIRPQQRRHLSSPHILIRPRRVTHTRILTCSILARRWALCPRPLHLDHPHRRLRPYAATVPVEGRRWSRGVALEVGG
jgi:hypothetical protein